MSAEIPNPNLKKLPAEWKGIIPSTVFLEEAKKIVEMANGKGLLLRVMGALAIRLHCSERHPEGCDLVQRLGRTGKGVGLQEFSDLDFVTYKKHRKQVESFFVNDLNYKKRPFTYSYSNLDREIYYHPQMWWNVDIFYDRLVVANHPFAFYGRLELDEVTLTVTDLLLEKFQMVNPGLKDLKDVILLIRSHAVGNTEKETINADYISELLAKDWGFYYTFTTNLKDLINMLENPESWAAKRKDFSFLLNLNMNERYDIIEKTKKIIEYIDRKPKSLSWKLREKIGTKKIWYQEVENPEKS